MAGTIVENAVCDSCGSKIREGSSFCFNCGETVAPEDAPPPAIVKPDAGLLNGEDPRRAKTVAFNDAEPAPIAIPQGKLDVGRTLPNRLPEDASPRETVLERREEIRQPPPARTRTRVKKAAEVEWVERTSPGWGFIVAVVLLAAFVGFLVFSAIYLR